MESDAVKVIVLVSLFSILLVGGCYLYFELGEKTCMERVDRIFDLDRSGLEPSPSPSPSPEEEESDIA